MSDPATAANIEDDAGQRLIRRVRRAADRVLGTSAAGREVAELCREHAEARHRLLTDRTDDQTVVAVVGATGQGKSWLVRQLIRGGPATAIVSGNRLSEATEKCTWVGPRPPADLDVRHEQFVACDAAHMQSIGLPYLLVDAPGATDDRRGIAETAQRALSTAGVLVLVIRRDQLRSQRIAGLAAASEGSILVPVVNAVRPADEAARADVEALIGRLRQTAPQSIITSPVLINDFEIDAADFVEDAVAVPPQAGAASGVASIDAAEPAGKLDRAGSTGTGSSAPDATTATGAANGSEETPTEVRIGRAAAKQVAQTITTAIEESGGGDQRRSVRLAALDGRFMAAIGSAVGSHLPELTQAVDRLHREARQLPGDVASSLLGGGAALRAAVRSRLRLAWLTDTAALFFPYRSLLSLLNLTHGAWDRVMLSLAGSLPSLLSAVYAGAKNLGDDRAAAGELRDGLRRRASAAVADRLGPIARRFRDELALLRQSDGEPTASSERWTGGAAWQSRDDAPEETDPLDRPVASLAGLDSLQHGSQSAFDDAVTAGAASPRLAVLSGLIGTLLFWAFLSGPLIGLYADYLVASTQSLGEVAGDVSEAGHVPSDEHWSRFPRPDASFLLTSLLLSLLPTALFAMVAVSVIQSRRRVDRIEADIRRRHDELIEQLQRDGVLRLAWRDPTLADAEFLLSLGRSNHVTQEST